LRWLLATGLLLFVETATVAWFDTFEGGRGQEGRLKHDGAKDAYQASKKREAIKKQI
jgi:hypothetical protein